VHTGPGPSHYGEAVQDAEAAQAERRVVARLQRLGWHEPELKARRKGDLRKVALALELRSHTTRSLAWIAQRLSIGSRGYLAWLLQHRRKGRLTRTGRRLLNICQYH
jgi:hypothetical protein